MIMPNSSKPLLIVTAREKFNEAVRSLESLYQNTKIDFDLIYLESSGSKKHRAEIVTYQKKQGFELVVLEKFLYPNAARNLGLKRAEKYAPEWVAFLDNDVVFAPGWLTELIRVAETMEVAVVSPLICQNGSDFAEVHTAGGTCRVVAGELVEVLGQQGEPVATVSPNPRSTELFEFHCVLFRYHPDLRFNPKLYNTREHLDASLQVQKEGGRIYLAPQSRVAYLPTRLETLADLLFYELRWSRLHKQKSLAHFARKWNVTVESTNRRPLDAPRRGIAVRALLEQLKPYGSFEEDLRGILFRGEPYFNQVLGSFCKDFYQAKPVITAEYGG